MAREIVSYAYGEFNDYKGNMHRVIVCSVSKRFKNAECPFVTEYDNEDEYYSELEKSLSIGVAICNPIDEYDESKGEMMAYNRAISDGSIVLYSTRAGMFNTQTVTAIMNNYLDYIKRDPGSIIKGYDLAKKKWQERLDFLDDIKKMNEEDIKKIQILANSTQETIDYAKKIAKLL